MVFLGDVRKIQVAAFAAHLRPPKGEPLRPDRPSQVGKPAKGKVPRFTVRPSDASRWQNCSASAMGDVPWEGKVVYILGFYFKPPSLLLGEGD
jgi:hypothetical protein